MKPTRIPDHNIVFVPPEGHAGAPRLHVRDTLVEGERTLESAWEPLGEEAGWLFAGGNLHLNITSERHPFVKLEAQLPPEDSPIVFTVRRVMIENGKQAAARVELFLPAQSKPAIAAHHAEVDVPIGNGSLGVAVGRGVDALQRQLTATLAFGGKTG